MNERFGGSFTLRENERTLSLFVHEETRHIAFDNLQPAFRRSSSNFSCGWWDASAEGLLAPIANILPAPSEFELPAPLVEYTDKGAVVHYDILGLTFWMLTRQEEIGRSDLDEHQRFPATSSHAFRHGYLERPIVDEWLNILGQVIQRVWPHLSLKVHQFQTRVSHDVDSAARYGLQTLPGLARVMAGDVVLRSQVATSLKAPFIWLKSRNTIHASDPHNTFDWLMEQSERAGIMSAFYFICGRTNKHMDANYDPEQRHIGALMQRIHRRGHEIGLHPSYETFRQPKQLAAEAGKLRRICKGLGIQQSLWGGRMHYLRWDQSITLLAWQSAGLDYDSTLGYADHPGFRCGTCFEYPAFDLASDQLLSLRIRPLVVMECTVMEKHYLGLGVTEAAYQKFSELKSNCIKVGGVFSLLWHNSNLTKRAERELYIQLIGR